jgi:hypothetical protein
VPALPDVGRRELPVLLGQVDPLEEADPLLFFREVEEQLDDLETVVAQVAFPVVDLPVAALPDVLSLAFDRQLLPVEVLRMHSHDQHFLVVRPVEDRDVAARGQSLRVAPQVIVVEFFRRRHLEAGHLDALRVNPAHDVPDRAVLAAGVKRLQAHEHAVGVLGGQPGLIVGQHVDPGPQQPRAVFLPQPVELVTGIEVRGQLHPRTRLDSQWLDQFRDPRGLYVVGHPHP